MKKKVFVLDTNVIIHSADCINKFENNDIVIPTTVLEELDKLKKGHEEKNYHVREFIRRIDELRKHRITKMVSKKPKNVSALCDGGVSLGEGLGKIQVKVSGRIISKVKNAFPGDTHDNRILSIVLEMQEDPKEVRDVIFVTKDVGLRIKADSMGIKAEDYENDNVEWNPNSGESIIIDDISSETIKSFNEKKEMDEENTIEIMEKNPKDNPFLILRNSEKSTLARIVYEKDSATKKIIPVFKKTVSQITPRNSEQSFLVEVLSDLDIKLIAASGKAGTGKTLIAMAVGLELLKQGIYEQLIVASAMVPLSNKDIGALPGDIDEKVSPYMQGIFDNLAFIKSQLNKKDAKWAEDLTDKQKQGRLKTQPLASIRGRSLNNTFFIIDEAQNLTPHEIKTIVTRAGENTKIVICGDIFQIDNPYLGEHSNGLSHLINRMNGQSLFAHVHLLKSERSELAEIAANLL